MIHYIVVDEYFSEYNEDMNEQRGIFNTSLFMSAVNEPRQTFDKEDLYPTIFDKAAVYLRSIAQNHCFYNGNKRTGLMSMIIFLEQNGYEINAAPNKLLRLAKAVVIGNLSIHHIKTKYLKKYCHYTGSKRQHSSSIYTSFKNFITRTFTF